VVLVDDVQNFAAIPEAVDILRLVLQRDEIQEQTRFLFVLSSTPEAWSTFIHKHNPVGRFFRTRLELQRLDEASVHEVIQGSLQGTGVSFSPDLLPMIYRYCQGHPYELQVLCSALYEQQLGGQVTRHEWAAARRDALRELGHSHFSSRFSTASEQEREVLWIVARIGGDSLAGIKKSITRLMKAETSTSEIARLQTNINEIVGRLVDKELMQKPARGVYEIEDLMFRDFIVEFHRPDVAS
jgi:hypothetical protein